MAMTEEPQAPTWFPDDKLNPAIVGSLSVIMMQAAREAGFSRNSFAAAIAQCAEALCGHDLQDLDADVQRFVGERLIAAGTSLRGAIN